MPTHQQHVRVGLDNGQRLEVLLGCAVLLARLRQPRQAQVRLALAVQLPAGRLAAGGQPSGVTYATMTSQI